jgi:hypothetical protein
MRRATQVTLRILVLGKERYSQLLIVLSTKLKTSSTISVWDFNLAVDIEVPSLKKDTSKLAQGRPFFGAIVWGHPTICTTIRNGTYFQNTAQVTDLMH